MVFEDFWLIVIAPQLVVLFVLLIVIFAIVFQLGCGHTIINREMWGQIVIKISCVLPNGMIECAT